MNTKNMMLIKWVRIFLLVLMVCHFSTVKGQGTSPVFTANTVLVINNDLTIDLMDVVTLERTFLIDASAQGTNSANPDVLLDFAMVRGSRYLYMIRGPFVPLQKTPIPTQLVQIDLLSQELTVLHEQTNLQRMRLSPDGTRMFLYGNGPNEYWGNPPTLKCLFEINNQTCTTPPNNLAGRWINEEEYWTFTTDSSGRVYHIVDLSNSEIHTPNIPSNVWIDHIELIPNTRNLLLSTNIINDGVFFDPPYFEIYNLDTDMLLDLGYNAVDNERYTTVVSFNFSPDNRRLIYGGRNIAVVDFESGYLIAELQRLRYVDWLPEVDRDSQRVIFEQETGDVTIKVSTFNVFVGIEQIIYEGNADGFGRIVVPHLITNHRP